ncbi:MAG TPA: hypothetical protein VGG96_04165 [Steroidobacteraceae bacterium]|jgi:uncharacterized protein involved in response to NO
MMPLLRYGFRPFFLGAGLMAAAFLWTEAFVLFTWVYAPMLLAPRTDGKPG